MPPEAPNTNPAPNISQSRDLALLSLQTTTAADTPVVMASGALNEIPRLVNPPRQSPADILDPEAPIFFPQPTQLPQQANLSAQILIPQVLLTPVPVTSVGEAPQASSGSGPQNGYQILPKFPSNASCQRTSNVPVSNPEAEFQQTALDSCRSTIAQQEADLKRLNETLDLRNKRIMQLDGQVGAATNYIASRDTPIENARDVLDNGNGSLLKINDNLNLLLSKLAVLTDQISTKSQQVNVYNSMSPQAKTILLNKTSQTTNESCSKSVQTCDNTAESMETNENEEPEDTITVLQCTICSRILKDSSELDNHIESVHSPTSCGEGSGSPTPSAAAVSDPSPTSEPSDL